MASIKVCPACGKSELEVRFYRTESMCVKCKIENVIALYRITKEKFFSMYGSECTCCGETRKEFLTVEHINGQRGKKKENTMDAFRKAVKQYIPNEYKVLCMNCNHSLGRYGYCPHKGVETSLSLSTTR